MMSKSPIAIILIVTLSCYLSAAQQPAVPNADQVGATNMTCSNTTTKPTPTVSDYKYQTCIVMKFAAYLQIGENLYVELKNGKVNNSNSRCENITAKPEITPKIEVNFDCGTIVFDIAHNSSSTYVSGVSGYYTGHNNATIRFADISPRFATSQSGHYYKCNAEQAIAFMGGNTSLVLSQVAIEAYRNSNGTDFYQIQEECSLDSQPVSDLVRIGVGICLVALVAIVLVAYFVGRRRWAERSSYESV